MVPSWNRNARQFGFGREHFVATIQYRLGGVKLTDAGAGQRNQDAVGFQFGPRHRQRAKRLPPFIQAGAIPGGSVPEPLSTPARKPTNETTGEPHPGKV
jgi:hypothetical protein